MMTALPTSAAVLPGGLLCPPCPKPISDCGPRSADWHVEANPLFANLHSETGLGLPQFLSAIIRSDLDPVRRKSPCILLRVCANFAARPVFHHGAPCVAAANGARRSLPMASTACVSPSASLRLPLPHGCQDIFTDTRSACLSGFQGSIPLRTQTARGGSLKSAGLGDGSPRRGLSVRVRHSHSPSPKLSCTTL